MSRGTNAQLACIVAILWMAFVGTAGAQVCPQNTISDPTCDEGNPCTLDCRMTTGDGLLGGIVRLNLAVTQVLGVAAQRAVTEMRRRVQSHVLRLPVSRFDSTQTGVLISRIMGDADGLRNLVGSGLVQRGELGETAQLLDHRVTDDDRCRAMAAVDHAVGDGVGRPGQRPQHLPDRFREFPMSLDHSSAGGAGALGGELVGLVLDRGAAAVHHQQAAELSR